jgi:hypothetical protein
MNSIGTPFRGQLLQLLYTSDLWLPARNSSSRLVRRTSPPHFINVHIPVVGYEDVWSDLMLSWTKTEYLLVQNDLDLDLMCQVIIHEDLERLRHATCHSFSDGGKSIVMTAAQHLPLDKEEPEDNLLGFLE